MYKHKDYLKELEGYNIDGLYEEVKTKRQHSGFIRKQHQKVIKESEQTMKTTKSIDTKPIEYLTQKEHAARLGLSRQAIYKAQKFAPRFKTVRFHKREYYVWEDGRPVLIGEK